MKFCTKSILGDTILYAVDVLPKKVDPHTCSDYVEYIISEAVTNLLFQYDNSSHQYVSKNVEQITVSKDKLKYTLHMRKDMYWNDGTIVKAQDFVNGIYRILFLGEECPIYNIIDAIKNWDLVANGEMDQEKLGIQAVDEYTLLIELDYPMPYIYELLATIFISPRKEEKQSGTPLFSGPFYIAFCDTEKIVLERNPFYLCEQTHQTQVKTIEFKLFQDMYEALNRYKNGKIGITCNTQFPYHLLEDFSHYEDFQEVSNSGLNFILQISDLDLKNRIQQVIHREIICEKLFHAITPLYSFIKENSYMENERKSTCFEIEQGKVIKFLYSDYYPNRIVAEEIKSQLEAELNINICLKQVTLDELIRCINKGEYEIALDICFFSVSHPIAMCMNFINNLSDDFSNAMIDVIEKHYNGSELDMATLDEIIRKGLPIIPLFAIQSLQCINSSISNYRMKEDGSVLFENLYLG